MPYFYRGAGVGTYWHTNNAQLDGFLARRPTEEPSRYLTIRHIQNGSDFDPYIFLTRSYEVAEAYAFAWSRERPTESVPAYVYEIYVDRSDEETGAVKLIDPVVEIVRQWPEPVEDSTFHHDGGQDFLHAVIDPVRFRNVFERPYKQAPPAQGTPRQPLLRAELEAMTRTLRDAEILAVRSIPARCVKNRFQIVYG